MENTQPYVPVSRAKDVKSSVGMSTHLALAALMALATATSACKRAESSPSSRMEAKGSKVETFKNVTVQAIGPSHIFEQKRYQEIAILAGWDPKTHSGTLTVRVVNAMWTDHEQIGQLTKGADGELWFTSQRVGKPIYMDVPSDGKGEQ